MPAAHGYSRSDIVETTLVVGLEIHVELSTRTRMFTRIANVAHRDHFDAPPNTLVDPVVMALPGALPSMNKEAVERSMLVGMALNCRIPDECRWDRKNYFYPDMPKGYQISQYDLPLCVDGFLDIDSANGNTQRIGIIRAHLEEDAGKLGHDAPDGSTTDGSLVDLNRAGTPLLEIVTAPDFRNADDVITFARELHTICCFLNVTEGIMQRGHMRFEPNVNLHIVTSDRERHVTPIVEMKNLNSFRSVHAAIEYESQRQISAWLEDGQTHGSGMKVTRGWNDERGVSFVQREKEDAHDYRYFPEPDLVPVRVSEEWRAAVRAQLPELPRARRTRYIDELGLSPVDATVLSADRRLCAFFEDCVELLATSEGNALDAAKMLLNVVARIANERNVPIAELGLTPTQVVSIIAMRAHKRIGSTNVGELMEILVEHGDADTDPEALATDRGMLQVSDTKALDEWIAQAVEAEPQSASDFAAGKDAAIGRLMGAVMQRSGGQADAGLVRERLVQILRDAP